MRMRFDVSTVKRGVLRSNNRGWMRNGFRARDGFLRWNTVSHL